MNNRQRLLNFVNRRLRNDKLCDKYEIPLFPTVKERFNYIKYAILELWSKEETKEQLVGLFGLHRWKEIYLLLK